MAIATQSPTTATGAGWTNPGNFDGSTAGAATVTLGPEVTSNQLIGANLGFDAAIPAGATITQVRSRIYWGSSSCVGGGIVADWGLYVSGVSQGGGGFAACQSAAWSAWYTSTGSWTRGNLLDGTLTIRVIGGNENLTLNRSMSVSAGEVEVTYTAGGVTTVAYLACLGVG